MYTTCEGHKSSVREGGETILVVRQAQDRPALSPRPIVLNVGRASARPTCKGVLPARDLIRIGVQLRYDVANGFLGADAVPRIVERR